jgi:hypothetical protein
MLSKLKRHRLKGNSSLQLFLLAGFTLFTSTTFINEVHLAIPKKCYYALMETGSDKRPTTIYIDPEVLEFLTTRSAKGAGSVSQQLEELAKRLMPLEKEQKALERKHAQGYKKHPVKNGEFDDFYTEQNLENV